jgi:Type ISP C-terminal specificity domain
MGMEKRPNISDEFYSKVEFMLEYKPTPEDIFMDVPEAVWNFHVGGYQVCQKWLKDRKGRTLSQDDIEHYQKIVVALGQSIDLMAKIDAAIPNWPIDAEYN